MVGKSSFIKRKEVITRRADYLPGSRYQDNKEESKDGGTSGRERGRQGEWEGAREGWREGRSLGKGFDLMRACCMGVVVSKEIVRR